MNIADINRILGEMKAQLSAPIAEQDEPNQHNPAKLSGAQRRLQGLYKKLTAGRSDDTEVKAYGADR